MTPAGVIFVLVAGIALATVPRKFASLPLIAGACLMTLGQTVDLGPFTFSALRLLILVGLIRAALSRELPRKLNPVDLCVIGWSAIAIASSAGHDNFPAALTVRLGMVYNSAGVYFLLRSWSRSQEDLEPLYRSLALLFIVLAASMSFEQLAHRNLFAFLGGVDLVPEFREGRFRASGPFSHPILAGTVAAVSMPLMLSMWPRSRMLALAGLCSCAAMIIASASSGPVMSAAIGLFAIALWPLRSMVRAFKWLALAAVVLTDLAMKAPFYYLLARIDIVGGSTGYHRAALIESSIRHLPEWWMFGTDYTRHWMPTGVPWSPAHTDITNHYLSHGVMGGLPLLLMFVATLVAGFRSVGVAIGRPYFEEDHSRSRLVWALGASLLAHAVTCISVTYYDQSFLFIYLTLASVGAAVTDAAGRDVTPSTRSRRGPMRLTRRYASPALRERMLAKEPVMPAGAASILDQAPLTNPKNPSATSRTPSRWQAGSR